MATHKDSM